uniref:Uncharacterized protein n=1 Tax=Hippocampus comes TaxID=109280 RepID=A0A3Q2Y267_HIPCM
MCVRCAHSTDGGVVPAALLSSSELRGRVVLCMRSLRCQMTEFEASAEPLQEWLNSAEVRVQESSARLHDLSAKKQELGKLQVIIERLRFQICHV